MPFPLPLTPFERYYWCDDRADYPTTYLIELTFEGELQRAAVDHAFRAACPRHPMLTARVEVDPHGIPQWVAADDAAPKVDWGDDSQPISEPQSGWMDLTSSTGLRVWGRLSRDTSRLVLRFHHACCDALGALQFIEDVLIFYAGAILHTDPSAQLRPLDKRRLRWRGDFGLTAANYRPNLRDTWTTARFWSHRLRPANLLAGPSLGSTATQDREDAITTKILTATETDLVRHKAAELGVSVNDLMLRDVVLCARDWNRNHGGRTNRLVINVPVNLRQRDDKSMPAANVLGFWFLTRASRDCDQHSALLHSIREEMLAVRKWRLPLYFIGGLGLACRWPRVMSWALHRDHSFATIVFSYLGRLFSRTKLPRSEHRLVCGNVVLNQVTGVPLIRPGTRAGITMATYANRLTWSIRCDGAAFETVDAEQLVQEFSKRIRATCHDD